ncbi:MAG: hypothetical protein HW416_441, partial [Chloroflexi bacterium]|nr:hypothetical protein [Chloroflexota bacterium]
METGESGVRTMDDMQRCLVEEELEHYRDGWISRREFIQRSSLIGVAAVVAAAIAASVTPAPARAAPPRQASPFSVPEGDPTIGTDWISVTTDDGVVI